MLPQFASNGTSIAFGLVQIGYVTGFDGSFEVSETVERFGYSSEVVGTGASARVVKRLDVTSIDPPSFDLTFFGPPSLSESDRGRKATLSLSGPWGAWSGEAILRSVRITGSSGQWVTGAASFQATGE